MRAIRPGPWMTWAYTVAEYASLLGIALVPVVISRRARAVEFFRPAEWLLIVNATRSIHSRLLFGGLIDWLVRLFGGLAKILNWEANAGRFRSWYLPGIAGLCLVVAGYMVVRNTRRHTLKLVLLAFLPLFVIWGPALLFSTELDRLWRVWFPTTPSISLLRAAYLRMLQAPENLVVGVAFVATVLNLAARDRARWSIQEWAALAIAIVTGAVGLLAKWPAFHEINPWAWYAEEQMAIYLAAWGVELLLTWFLVRSLGGFWRQLLAGAETGV